MKMNHKNRQTLQMETNYKFGTLIEKIENLRHDLKSQNNKISIFFFFTTFPN